MADITEIQSYRPTSFTVGSDVYKGIRSLVYGRRANPTTSFREEGQLTPTARAQVPTDQLPFFGTITGKSSALEALAGTSVASFTIDYLNGLTGATVTKTFSSVNFLQFQDSVQEATAGDVTLAFEATTAS